MILMRHSLPLILLLGCFAGLYIPALRSPTEWLLAEGHPVELLTFGLLMAGGAIGISVAGVSRRRGLMRVITLFFFLFGFHLLVVGMEEVAWGQKFIDFDTPEAMKSINQQGEVTIHNISGIHGKTEWLRFFFGLGGLVGILFAKSKTFSILATPPTLIPWILVIFGHASFDVLEDYINTPNLLSTAMSRSAELVEAMIGYIGFEYSRIKLKTIKAFPPPEGTP